MNYFIIITFVIVCVLILSGSMNKQTIEACDPADELTPEEIRGSESKTQKTNLPQSSKHYAKKLGGNSNDCTMGQADNPDCVGSSCSIRQKNRPDCVGGSCSIRQKNRPDCVGDSCSIKPAASRNDNLEVY